MKLKVGDIFTIPIDENRNGIGQILSIPNKDSFIIIIFDLIREKGLLLENLDLNSCNIVFLGYTLDAKLYHKHWLIIGNSNENISSVYLPYYKLGTPPDDIFITNYKGERIRKALLNEFEKLNYQSVVAPVRYETALKAHFNLAEWEDRYNDLLYTYTLDSIKIVER
jgi:hypothetical protein